MARVAKTRAEIIAELVAFASSPAMLGGLHVTEKKQPPPQITVNGTVLDLESGDAVFKDGQMVVSYRVRMPVQFVHSTVSVAGGDDNVMEPPAAADLEASWSGYADDPPVLDGPWVGYA